MEENRNPFTGSPPPPTSLPLRKPDLSPFYYGLVVIGSTAVVLALYNLIIVAWCRQGRRRRPPIPATEFVSQSFETSSTYLVSSFKYRKETGEQDTNNECAVCLSVFEDGEDIRRLPNCNHSFHAPCIDMWLYSHSDCPLCRATVGSLVARCHVHLENQNSQSSIRIE